MSPKAASTRVVIGTRIIGAVRVLLELFALVVILLALARWFFPGAWRGIGVGEALKAAQLAGAEAGKAPDPIAAPADLMALLLTVVTIVLTAVAFFVGIGAFFGYGAIKDLAEATAREKIKPLQASLDDATARATTNVDKALASLDDRFIELRGLLEAERAEGSGLVQGKGNDQIANASRNPPSNAPE